MDIGTAAAVSGALGAVAGAALIALRALAPKPVPVKVRARRER